MNEVKNENNSEQNDNKKKNILRKDNKKRKFKFVPMREKNKN